MGDAWQDSQPMSSPVGSYLKQKPRTKEEIIKTQIGGLRFRTRKVYYISTIDELTPQDWQRNHLHMLEVGREILLLCY